MVVIRNALSMLRRRTPSLEVSVEFTEGSRDKLGLHEAVRFAQEQGGILQSAKEAAVGRYEDYRNGQREFTDQLTRTAAAYFEVNGKYVVAFDDINDPNRNIVLARAMEGFNTLDSKCDWVLPFSDRDVKDLIVRAAQNSLLVGLTKKILYYHDNPVLDERERLKKSEFWERALKAYSLDVEKDSRSSYGKSHLVNGILGDSSEHFAKVLKVMGCGMGVVDHIRYDVFREIIDRYKIKEGVLMQAVVLCDDGKLDACGSFWETLGHANGVKYSVKESAK